MKKTACLNVLLIFLILSTPLSASAKSSRNPGLDRIRHIVVIYLENHSFDNLYGLFPGADGLANAPEETMRQTDRQGGVYATLPRVMNTEKKPPVPDERFPSDLPNRPFEISQYVAIDQKIGDPLHRFYQHQAQINGGRMDRFAAVSDAGGLAMGYYDGRKLPLWEYAEKYTLADRFFQAAFGGSLLNHFWLVCACTPHHDDPPAESIVVLNEKGELIKDGVFTPDGYAVNTIQTMQTPHSPKITDPRRLLPPQTFPTIGDRLSEKKISWAWYSGGWNDAIAGKADESFQYHHQPFAYFERYAQGTRERARHLKDETDLLKAIEKGNLPAVSFYKPIGAHSEHPGYADLLAGEMQAVAVIRKIEQSRLWRNSVIIVTYDEYGGFWDHVPPPPGDRWGPGNRVPTIVISPFAKRGYVDHTFYDGTSILKFIETRFDLKPLGERDAKANDLLNALDL
jgi:phospholipase C